MTLKHIPGIKIGKVNELSIRLDWKVEVENDNENQKLIKEKWIWGLVKIVVEESKVDIVEKMKNAKGKDK